MTSTDHFQKALLGLSVVALTSQIVFQIVLGAFPPYGHFFPNCKLTTKVFCFIVFVFHCIIFTCFDSHFVVILSDAEFAFSSLLGSTYERLTRQIGLSRYGFHSLSFDHHHD